MDRIGGGRIAAVPEIPRVRGDVAIRVGRAGTIERHGQRRHTARGSGGHDRSRRLIGCPSHDARAVGVRRVSTGIVGADAIAVALPSNDRVVGVARRVGPLGGEVREVRAAAADAPLNVEESLVRRMVLPGELDQRTGARGGQSGWRGRRKGVHNDGTRGCARRTAAIGDRQGRREGPRSWVQVGGLRSRARGAIPERPCPRCHRSVGSGRSGTVEGHGQGRGAGRRSSGQDRPWPCTAPNPKARDEGVVAAGGTHVTVGEGCGPDRLQAENASQSKVPLGPYPAVTPGQYPPGRLGPPRPVTTVVPSAITSKPRGISSVFKPPSRTASHRTAPVVSKATVYQSRNPRLVWPVTTRLPSGAMAIQRPAASRHRPASCPCATTARRSPGHRRQRSESTSSRGCPGRSHPDRSRTRAWHPRRCPGQRCPQRPSRAICGRQSWHRRWP